MRRLAFAGALIALVAAGCGSKGVVKPLPDTVVGTLAQATPVAKGDPAAGKTLYESNGCAGCHTFKPAGSKATTGPDLDNLKVDAARAGKPLPAFVRESIVDPNAYIAKGYQPGIMPSTFKSLPKQQLDALVQFLTASQK